MFFSGAVHAELGLSTPPSKTQTKPNQPTSYRTPEQDQQYNNTIDGISKTYDGQTTAVNSPKYDQYLGNLDSTYNKMVDNINAGKPAGSSELAKYVPEKMPSGDTTGASSTSTATASSTKGSSEASTQTYASAQEEIIKSYCPKMCGSIQDSQMAYECNTGCAHEASLMAPAPAQQFDSSMLMILLMASLQ